MKSLNNQESLWSNVAVESLEDREEFAACFSCIFTCICFTCFCFLWF